MRPLHQSTIKLLGDCPRKFQLDASGVRTGRFDPFDRGSAVADALDAVRVALTPSLLDSVGAKPEETIARVLDERVEALSRELDAGRISREAYVDAVSILEGPIRDGNVPLGPPEGARRYSTEFAFLLALLPGEDPLDAFVEVRNPHEHDEDRPGRRFAGKFDVLIDYGTHGVIEDDKTWFLYPKAEEIEDDLQARSYAFAALAVFPKWERVEFRWNLVRHGYSVGHVFERNPEGPGDWFASTFDFLLGRFARVDDLANDYGSKPWPATVGDGCGNCPIRNKCPELAAAIEAGEKAREIDPETLAARYRALKPLVAEYERELRKIANEAPVHLGGGKFLGFKIGTKNDASRAAEDFAGLREELFLAVPGELSVSDFDEALDEFFPRRVSKTAIENAAKKLIGKAPHEFGTGWLAFAERWIDKVPTGTFTTFQRWKE